VLPFKLKFHQQDFMILLLINILVVVSYRLMTLTGEWSLIHVVLMGVGGYSSALLAKNFALSFWLTMPLAGIICALLAVLLSVPLFRMKQFYFLIGSFAAGEAIRLAWVYFKVPFGAAWPGSISKCPLGGRKGSSTSHRRKLCFRASRRQLRSGSQSLTIS
jgi:branched-chain amino acid transport system permease protein